MKEHTLTRVRALVAAILIAALFCSYPVSLPSAGLAGIALFSVRCDDVDDCPCDHSIAFSNRQVSQTHNAPVCEVHSDGLDETAFVNLTLILGIYNSSTHLPDEVSVEMDRGIYCCNANTMKLTWRIDEVHQFKLPTPASCTFARYNVRYCTYCGSVWERNLVGYYGHTHY